MNLFSKFLSTDNLRIRIFKEIYVMIRATFDELFGKKKVECSFPLYIELNQLKPIKH